MRLRTLALGSTAAALALGLLTRGNFIFAAFTLGVAGLGLGAAFIAALAAYADGRSRRGFRIAAGLALLFGPLPLAVPLGWAVNASDVMRAKAWCEAAVAGANTTASRSALVLYDEAFGDQCTVLDRTSFFGAWMLDPATDTWVYD